MCDIMEELNRRAVAEAKKEQKYAFAISLLKIKRLSTTEISLCTGLSLSEVEELAEKLNETEKLCV